MGDWRNVGSLRNKLKNLIDKKIIFNIILKIILSSFPIQYCLSCCSHALGSFGRTGTSFSLRESGTIQIQSWACPTFYAGTVAVAAAPTSSESRYFCQFHRSPRVKLLFLIYWIASELLLKAIFERSRCPLQCNCSIIITNIWSKFSSVLSWSIIFAEITCELLNNGPFSRQTANSFSRYYS